MDQNPEFYAVAAQVIPVLLLMTVLEGRWPQKAGPTEGRGFVALRGSDRVRGRRGRCAGLLGEPRLFGHTQRLVIGAILLGAILIILAVLPPPLRREDRTPLLENVSEDRRELVGRALAATITLSVLAALIALLIWLPD
jgi:ABC-type Fe3+ transport system permease subunit